MGTRFIRPGVTLIYFLPTIAASGGAPTIAEIGGGTELTDIKAVNGFSASNQLVETPDLESTWAAKIPGLDSAEDSSIEFYELKEGSPLLTTLKQGTVGYIVIASAGGTDTSGALKAADPVDVFPVQIAGTPKKNFQTGNEPASFTIDMAITSQPYLEVGVLA